MEYIKFYTSSIYYLFRYIKYYFVKKTSFLIFSLLIIVSFGCSKLSPDSVKSYAGNKLIKQGEFFKGRYSSHFEKLESCEQINDKLFRVKISYGSTKLEYICSIGEATVYPIENLEGFEKWKEKGIKAVGEIEFLYEAKSLLSTSYVTAVLNSNTSEWDFYSAKTHPMHRLLKDVKESYEQIKE